MNPHQQTSGLHLDKLDQLDRLALMIGIAGFAVLIVGIGWISGPAACIVAGLLMLGWSYLTARAVVRARRQAQRPDS
jgi:uncharacterized membrane protein